MDVIVLAIAFDKFRLKIPAYLVKNFGKVADRERRERIAPIFGNKDQMRVKRIDDMPSSANICIFRPYCYPLDQAI